MAIRSQKLSCPSAQPDMEGALVFGVINGTPRKPRVAYLRKEAVVDLDQLPDLAGAPVGHVFRIGAACEESRCMHFDGERCGLARRIAEQLKPVVDVLPACQLRPTCRWHAEGGADLCRRCPQIVTYASEDMADMARVALPVSEVASNHQALGANDRA